MSLRRDELLLVQGRALSRQAADVLTSLVTVMHPRCVVPAPNRIVLYRPVDLAIALLDIVIDGFDV